MSWTRYLYFKDCNVAIDVGKIENYDIDNEKYNTFSEFIDYMNRENTEQVVMNYLWEKCEIYDIDMWVSLMNNFLGGGKIISEEELSKIKDVRVVNRG